MSRWLIAGLGCWVLAATGAHGASPVMRVVRAPPAEVTLLRHGDFEQSAGGKADDWTAAPQGFALASGEGRHGSQALQCENPTGSGWFGASQTLTLNRTSAAPLVVRGWSKAENVGGSADSGYALYVDLIYTDGTPLWGQTANFRTGTHDWQQRELVVLPEKPVKTLTLHCLLRGHSGTAWFDDVTVQELPLDGQAVLFQGVAMVLAREPGKPAGKLVKVSTRDGLKLALRDNTVVSLQAAGRELACAAPSGFLARDVVANSDVFPFSAGQCANLGLKLQTSFKAEADHIVLEGRLSDITGKDRAVTLLFALPVDATGWRWADDIRRSRPIQGRGEFANTVVVRCGATGTMSLYPLAAVYDERVGLALALDMAHPAQYRLGYHAGTKQLYIAFDFGLVPETERFPSGADFRFVLFRFEPRWGFRAAFRKFMALFPDYFRVRSHDQGLWMPFTDISQVQGWQDFGFRYHEGNNNVPWDDAHGILSFRYTEPMTWWMPLAPGRPRTTAEAMQVRDEMASSARDSRGRMARVSQVAGMWDESGQPCLLFRNEPWCDGAVWSLNPNPDLPASPATISATSGPVEAATNNAATVYWNQSIKQTFYGPAAKGQLDGEYLDSLEGYVTADLNLRREHFRYTTVPLSFASDSKQPALFKGLAVFEFTKWLCDDVHRLGKLTFANGVPYRLTFLCPWLDVLGTETNWLPGGKYRPASDAQMSLWRTMAGAKPYLLLMNTDYDAFTPDLVERYFQRSLFYGMFPSMFSHNASDNPYWRNPNWYNRDRPLFKRYLPLIRRVAEAGWQPVTGASSDNDRVYVERFGPDAAGAVYLTLLNDTATPQTLTLRLDLTALGLKGTIAARELVSGIALDGAAELRDLRLQPEETKVILLTAENLKMLKR